MAHCLLPIYVYIYIYTHINLYKERECCPYVAILGAHIHQHQSLALATQAWLHQMSQFRVSKWNVRAAYLVKQEHTDMAGWI